MVTPGGTGSPALVISASPAPLPPSSSFILPLPSALPPPKKYTYLVAGLRSVDSMFLGRVCVAIIMSPFLFMGFLCAFSHDLGEICNSREFLEQGLQQR